MIRAIAFDLWETLITNTPEISRQQERFRLEKMEAILAARGLATSRSRVEHAHRHVWRRCQDLYWSADRDVPCSTQIEHFLEALDLAHDPALIGELEEVYAGAAVEALPCVVDGAHELLAELKGRGLRLGLISNTGRTPGSALREVLQRRGLASHFDAMVFSNEVGLCKPQQGIFETLRQALDVAFDEIVFVGDNVYVDVHGAQRCGMKGVHFVPHARGTAVAPDVDHGLEIQADATITDLRQLPALLDPSSSQSVIYLTATDAAGD